MNRVWIGIGILLVLLGLGLWTQRELEDIHGPIAADMMLAAEQAQLGNWEQAGQALARAEAAWTAGRMFTAALADHQPLEDIESLMARLSAHAAAGDRAAFAGLCADIACRVEAVSAAQKLTVSSLF